MTPLSPSEDERDSELMMVATPRGYSMADLDASIADALDSIEALMQPRRVRTAEDTETCATAGNRSVSTGDVRWFSDESTTSTSVPMQLPQDPPSPPLSSVSCSSLHDHDRHPPSSTPEASHQPTSPGIDHSNTQSSTVVELRRHSDDAVLHDSSQLQPPSVGVSMPSVKSSTRRPPPPVPPRRAISVGVTEDRHSNIVVHEMCTTTLSSAADNVPDTVHHPSTVSHSTDETKRNFDPAIDEHLTPQHSVTSDSTSITHGQTTTSVTTSTKTVSNDVSSFHRQLPAPPKPTETAEASSTSTSKGSSFSSVRALLNRKSGGSQRASTVRVDRPVRRSRNQVAETVPAKTTTVSDVTSAPASMSPSKTAPASDHDTTATEPKLQSSMNNMSGTTISSTDGTVAQVESKESVTVSSRSSSARTDDVKTEQLQFFDSPSSLSHDHVDHESVEASFEGLTKAMAILSPIMEGQRYGNVSELHQVEAHSSSAVNPDVLMTIRTYITSSLHQMRILEEQVKLIPMLQLRVSVLKEEKRLLKLQLQNLRNGSGAKTSSTEACVEVTSSELPIAKSERILPVQLERSSLSGQIHVPMEYKNVGVGDFYVNSSMDSSFYCPSSETALGQQSLRSSSCSETKVESSKHAKVETTGATKPESENNVDYPSVSLLVSKLQGQENEPPSTRRVGSVENTMRISVTSSKDHVEMSPEAGSPRSPAEESSIFPAVRRPRPPVPVKQISIHREEGKKQSTVGVQCTLLKDRTDGSEKTVCKISPPLLDSANKRVERSDFRNQVEPDLVTTHGLGGSLQNEHQLQPAAGYSLKTFVDKETETDRMLQHSVAVGTDSPTVVEKLSKFHSVDTKVTAQLLDCSINTDISGNIWSAEEYLMSKPSGAEHSLISKNIHFRSDVSLEPEVHEQICQQTTVSSFVGRSHIFEKTAEDSVVKHEVVPSLFQATDSKDVKDVSCSVDIVTKPVMYDASSCTDESLISAFTFDPTERKYAVEAKPSVKDAECLADITIKWPVDTTASNTEISMDQLLSRESPSVHEVGCNTIEPALVKERPGTLVDVACGSDDFYMEAPALIRDVTDVGCNTEARAKRDFGCGTIDERQPTKDVSCLADIKLLACDKSCSASVPVTDISTETVQTDEKSATTLTSSDVACLTDSLTTCEISSNTEEHVNVSSTAADVDMASNVLSTGVHSTYVETGCMTDISWKPSTTETGCGTDYAASSALDLEDASSNKPPSATVALNTDEWLLLSDLTFLDTLKELQKPSLADTASMTDLVDKVQTADISTNTIRPNAIECSTNTETEMEPVSVIVKPTARPAVCDAGCNTEADVKSESFSGKLSCSVACNTDTTVHPSAVEISSLVTGSSDTTNDLPHFQDAFSAIDSTFVSHVSVSTEVTSKPLFIDATAQTQPGSTAFVESESCSRAHLDHGTHRVQHSDKEVTVKADTIDVACAVSLRPPLRSIACGIDAEVVNYEPSSFSDVSDMADLRLFGDATATLYDKEVPSEPRQSTSATNAEEPVFRETREIACNTENTVIPWLFDDPLRLRTDTTASEDADAVNTAFRADEEGTNTCRFCGVESAQKPSIKDAASIMNTSHEIDSITEHCRREELLTGKAGFILDQLMADELSVVDRVDLPDDTVTTMSGHHVGVKMRHEIQDLGCDAKLTPTTDTAIYVDLVEAKQETIKSVIFGNRLVHGVLSGSASDSDVVPSGSTRNMTPMTDRVQQLMTVPPRSAKVVGCITSDVILYPSDSDDARLMSKSTGTTSGLHCTSQAAMKSVTRVVTECPTCLARRPTRDSSCGTDLLPVSADLAGPSTTERAEFSILDRRTPTTTEVACNTESPTATLTRDVGLNTEAPIDVASKPTRIPCKQATETRQPEILVAKPVTKDAICITDIVIAPSEVDEVLKKTNVRERSRTASSTAEVACNTDVTDSSEKSRGAAKLKSARPTVRSIGCTTELLSVDKKPRTRDAGCTARPQTKSQLCATDRISSEPVPETPVKSSERTRTGLQVARKTRTQTVTTMVRSSDIIPPSTPDDVPLLAAGKSPTFDVACGTDLEFHSKYFNVDDEGLLRQLSADDVAEVLRCRNGGTPLSLASPTCDVACNTEYDSRPLTPARLNYSRYYASAAVEPPPPTAADVACGPDAPSTAPCDVACGTEDLLPDTPFQTSSDTSGSHSGILDVIPTVSGSANHQRIERRSLPSAPTDEEMIAENTINGMTSKAVGDFDVRDELIVRSRQLDDGNSLPSTARQALASRKGLTLDLGLVPRPSQGNELTASRLEDFNNNDDGRLNPGEFQTHSVSSRWNEASASPTIPILARSHDVKFIDDDDSDSVDHKEFDRKTTRNINVDDDDDESSNASVDLGRRWGTVDLISELTSVSPLPSSSAMPLKGIMKSPKSSSEKTLSETKKGISFSQDTVFK